MALIPSFPDSGWERIPEGSAFLLEQMRRSLTVSIPWLCRGTRKSALWNEEVV
ncbi:MAG: hypothetical protein V7K14_22825 [Nostoc sp.]|uniref:hypothetical protein n=1 Tax=unclassified Nostoc TaxID=2593658 RepID=UPI0025E70C4A|nr:hypothetical protein [Nostoc sp. NMS7]MBN3947526.1 hypothetical protein [Nostoc sp. NMS7]